MEIPFGGELKGLLYQYVRCGRELAGFQLVNFADTRERGMVPRQSLPVI